MEKQIYEDIYKNAIIKDYMKDEIIVIEGSKCETVPFVIDGCLKIYFVLESGREITLYELKKGEFCLLSFLSAYKGTPYPACTISVERSKIALIPADVLKFWINEKKYWKEKFMDILSENLFTIFIKLNDILSRKLDSKLACYLLSHGEIIDKSHEEIAKDIGTSRVVVSRILKHFEKEGAIKIYRKNIKIIAPFVLKKFI